MLSIKVMHISITNNLVEALRSNQKWSYLLHTFIGKALAMYQASNANTNKMIRIAFGVALTAATLEHVLPALLPLVYMTVGYPSPDLWFTFTPYSIEKV